MKSLVIRGAMLLVVTSLPFLGGCGGDSSATTTEAVTTETSEAQTRRKEREAASRKVAPKPQDAQGIYQQELGERRLAAQKKALLVEEHLLQAQSYMEAKQYDKAEMSAFRALELDGTNEGGLQLLQSILAIKGDPRAEAGDVAAYMINKRRLIREARKAKVNDKFVRANNFFVESDLESAVVQLEEASTIMRFDEFQTDFGPLQADVPELLEVVKQRLSQQRKANEENLYKEVYTNLLEEEQKKRQQQGEQVRRLLIEAIEAFQRGDFESTEFLANRVLKLGPNQKAKELVYVARQARSAAWRESQYSQRRASYQKWLEEVRETQIPYTGILTWSENWDDISRRRGPRNAVAVQLQDSDAVRSIRAKLDNETVTLDYGAEETTLSDAIKDIRSRLNINMVIDREVESEKGEEPVNITLANHNLGSALRLMLENLGLAYSFRNDVLYITTTEKALGNPIPQVYWVRDLTISLPHFKAPNLNLRAGGTGEAAKTAIWGEDLERTTDTSIDQLMDLIRESVGAGTWENEGFSLGSSAGQIVAVTTPQIHQELTNFLDDLREFTKVTVHVEARFLSINKATLDLIGNEFRGLGGTNPGSVALLDDIANGAPDNASLGLDNGGPGFPAASSLSPAAGAFFSEGNDGDIRARTENIFNNPLGTLLSATGGATIAFTLLDDLQVTSLLRAVEKKLDNTVVSAPRLTIYNNQRANLTLVNQVSYVKDYDVEVAQTAFIADPLVDVVQDGLTLDVRPTVGHDRKYVTLEVQPTVATLVRPIRTFETNLSGLTTPVIIELPELEVQSAATTVRVPDNGYLVIGGLKHLSTVDRRSETPILSSIPILSFFFSTKGRSDELRDLIVILHVNIVDLSDQEKNLTN